MSSTITITAAPSSATTIIALPAQNPFTSASGTLIINRLSAILDKFSAWQDPLSLSLFTWGVDVLTVAPQIRNPGSYRQIALPKIDALFKEMLIDSLHHAPLSNPYLDRTWIWEKRDLDEYLKLAQRSPFDGLEMKPEPHSFAKEMVDWARSMPEVSFPAQFASAAVAATAASAVIPAEITTKEKEAQILSVMLLAQKSISLSLTKKHHKQILNASAVMDKFQKKLEENVKKETEAFQKKAEDHEKEVKSKIDQLEQKHIGTVNSLQSRIGDISTRLSSTENILGTTRSTVTSQQAQIRQLQEAYNAKCNEVANMDTGPSCVIS